MLLISEDMSNASVNINNEHNKICNNASQQIDYFDSPWKTKRMDNKCYSVEFENWKSSKPFFSRSITVKVKSRTINTFHPFGYIKIRPVSSGFRGCIIMEMTTISRRIWLETVKMLHTQIKARIMRNNLAKSHKWCLNVIVL